MYISFISNNLVESAWIGYHKTKSTRTQRKAKQTAQEKAQQYTIAFIVVSDWLKGWCMFSQPITKQKRANPKQSHIIVDT